MQEALIELLSDGAVHSGEELGRILGVTRAAVWKRLQSAMADTGLSIESVRGRGYRLSVPLTLLRHECWDDLPWPVKAFDKIDSTNAQALKLLANNTGPLLVLAEQQTAGRGRRGRQWQSPYGCNLYMSLLWPINDARRLEGLSLLVGLAVHRAFARLGFKGALKWPNDLLANDRKLGGILLELTGDPSDHCQVVIGIGININMLGDNSAIDQPWTSLAELAGRMVSRTEVLRALCAELNIVLTWPQLGFAPWRDEWERAHAWQGRSVCLSTGRDWISGMVLGVSDAGALRLSVEGVEQQFSGGEISLRLSNDS